MIKIEQNSRKIMKKLEQDGFVLVSIKGSHHKYVKNSKIVIIPHPKKDIAIGTARNIAKMAGWL